MRAVLIDEDEEDEQPKTPIHEGLSRDVRALMNGAHNENIFNALDGDSDVCKISSLG